MFVQIIQGPVGDSEEFHDALDQWFRELSPGAEGWLGTTAGVTAGRDAIAVVRFETVEWAQHNSHRPEQHQWWMETAKLFSGDVAFEDCTDVLTFLGGGSDLAGFVQVMQGEVRDVERSRQLMGEMERFREFRPEMIGGIDAIHADRAHFTDVIYFSSEEEAREGERKPIPPDLQATFGEQEQVYGEIRYLDLTEPWLYSPPL